MLYFRKKMKAAVTSFLKENFPLLAIFFGAFVLRISLSGLIFNGDLLSNAGWGSWIYHHSPLGFYENNIWIYSWPTQPPLISYIYGLNYEIGQKLVWLFSYMSLVIATHRLAPTQFYWFFDFAKWFASALYKDTPFTYGFLISMKLIAILADMVLAAIIYNLGKKVTSKGRALILTSFFLLLPFGWYISALWGQYDQLMTLLVLGSFLILYKRMFLFSAICLFLAIQIKPTALFFVPFFSLYFLYQRPKIKEIFFSGVGLVATFLIVTTPFTGSNPIDNMIKTILPKIFNSDRLGLVNHAFNFWQFIRPFGGWSTDLFLGIQALVWGVVFLAIVNLAALAVILKKYDLERLLTSLYIVSGGTYLFGTGMVDRYFLPAIVFLLILSFRNKGLFGWWIAAALIFSANLFYTWGFPILNENQTWKEPMLIRLLSLSQLTIFFICIYKLKVFNSPKLNIKLSKS